MRTPAAALRAARRTPAPASHRRARTRTRRRRHRSSRRAISSITCLHGREVQRRQRATVVEPPTGQHEDVAAEGVGEVVRPVEHRRHVAPGGQRDAHDRSLRELPALDHGIRELRGADHHRADGGSVLNLLEDARERSDDALGDVFARALLDRRAHLAPIEQHGVRVRATDVDPDAQRHAVAPPPCDAGRRTAGRGRA